MEQQFSEFCVYTLKYTPDLDQLLTTETRKGQFSERKVWTRGHQLLREAQATQKAMPILFSPADQDAGVCYAALLTDIHIDGETTRYTFDQLIKLSDDYPRSKLRKRSNNLPLADRFIRNYAICYTPMQAAFWFSAAIVYPDEILTPTTFREGKRVQVTVNAYERNNAARSHCLQQYGTNCAVCGLDFEQTYGEIGKGFIHVHHKNPLAQVKDEYDLDPIRDLIPVCPNCHAMLHQTTPPLTIEVLQQHLRKPVA